MALGVRVLWRSTGCELEVHCTATADQILNGDYVRVRLIKQHCADGSRVPPQPGPDPAEQAELTKVLQAVQELRVEKGVYVRQGSQEVVR